MKIFLCCDAIFAFLIDVKKIPILVCKGFYQYAAAGKKSCTIATQQIDIVMESVAMPMAGSGCSFRPASKICVIVTRFSGSQDTGLVELETRHRSCVNGLVLAVSSCIPGGNQ